MTKKSDSDASSSSSSSSSLRFCVIFFVCTIGVLFFQLVTPSQVVQISRGGDSDGDSSSSTASSPISVPKALLATPRPASSSKRSAPISFDASSSSDVVSAFVSSIMNQTSHVKWHGTEAYRSVDDTSKQCPAFSSGKEKITSCPDEDMFLQRWINHLKKSGKLPDAQKRWVIVDVGVNKGYAVAGMLSTLGIKNVTREQLALAAFKHAFVENRVPPKLRLFLAGVCCDVLETTDNTNDDLGTSKENVDLFLYDGLSHNANFVRKFYLDSGMSPEHTTVRHAAVAERTGTVSFPDPGFFGSEFGSIEGASAMQQRARNVPVPMVTLDSELEKVPYIDILLTDTEGSDFRVAAGSQKHLLAGRVGLYIFELHGLRSRFPRLSTAMRALDTHYKCYFPAAARNPPELGAHKLIPMSGDCFRKEFDDISGWHNVVCANKKETELIAALEELKDEPAPAMVICNSQVTPGELAKKFFKKHKDLMPVWRWALQGVPKKRYPRL